MQGKRQYSEKLFTSFQLSDRVPADNFYRRLSEVLDLRWTYKRTKKYYGKEGQQSIDPVVFFKLILIGYLENLASDRRIINTVSMRLDMLYFVGYDIDEPLPWHSTLSRTRQLYGQEIFKDLFREVLKQCIDKGMVAGRRQAIDSVHVKANASMDSLKRKEILQDGELYAVTLKEDEQQDAPHNEPGNNDTHHSPTDPDARIAKKPGKPTDLKYLGQVSVDTAHHVITEIQAHQADKRDSECLGQMITGVIENLHPLGLAVEEVLCDTNYSSGKALQYLEANELKGFIPNLGQYKAERIGFTYDEHYDHYMCSQGAQLRHTKTYADDAGYIKKEYRSSRTSCNNCQLRTECIGKSTTKRLTHTIDKPLYNRMHERMQTAYGKRMMRLRQSTVEPVLGTLVNFLGMRKVNTKGLQQADKCMLMAATAYNIKKMMRFRTQKVATMVQMIKKVKENLENTVLMTLSLLSRSYPKTAAVFVQNCRQH